MYEIIAPTLFQKKICRLPGIGTLVMVVHPAKVDLAKSLIKSPTETINFIREENEEKAFNEFSAISELLQKSIDENGSYMLEGIGTFIKDDDVKVRFTSITVDPAFTPSVPINLVARQNASQNFIADDQETINLSMPELLEEKQPDNEQWEIWAIALAAVAVGMLIFYFYHHGFKSLGNTSY